MKNKSPQETKLYGVSLLNTDEQLVLNSDELVNEPRTPSEFR